MDPKVSNGHDDILTPPVVRLIRRRLLRWYDRHKRHLPWRHRPQDAYAQMLAELMLQQTQVATVIGYYERFLARFPTVRALAEAELDEVLALWSGLGYYRRARHLHAAAKSVVEDHGGVLPRDVAGLMTLPGIGRYTAGAIASVAYGVRAPVLDGNVLRVLTRLAGISEDPRSPAVQRRLWKLAEDLLPVERCGDFNQALMELGATVCSPRTPQCLLCPLHEWCKAARHGLTDRVPMVGRRAKVAAMHMVTVAVGQGERLLFEQSPADGLWAGLWALPAEAVADGESPAEALSRLRRRLPVGTRIDVKPRGEVTRQLTHRRVRFSVFEGRCSSGSRGHETADRTKSGTKWVGASELTSLGVSRACLAILDLLEWA